MVALIIALLTGLTVSAWILLSPEVKWEVWSESVTQSCLTLCDPIAHQAPLSMEFSRQEYWSGLPCPPLRGIFPTQGLNSGLLHCTQILYHLSHQGSPSDHISGTTQPECPLQSTLAHFWVGFPKTGLPSQPVFNILTPDRFLVSDRASECDSAICFGC